MQALLVPLRLKLRDKQKPRQITSFSAFRAFNNLTAVAHYVTFEDTNIGGRGHNGQQQKHIFNKEN